MLLNIQIINVINNFLTTRNKECVRDNDFIVIVFLCIFANSHEYGQYNQILYDNLTTYNLPLLKVAFPTPSKMILTPAPSVILLTSSTKSLLEYRITSSAPQALAFSAFSSVLVVPITYAPGKNWNRNRIALLLSQEVMWDVWLETKINNTYSTPPLLLIGYQSNYRVSQHFVPVNQQFTTAANGEKTSASGSQTQTSDESIVFQDKYMS